MKKNEEKQEITQSTMKVAEDFFMMEVVIRCKSEMMSYNYNPSRDGRRSEPSPRWQPAEKVMMTWHEGVTVEGVSILTFGPVC